MVASEPVEENTDSKGDHGHHAIQRGNADQQCGKPQPTSAHDERDCASAISGKAMICIGVSKAEATVHMKTTLDCIYPVNRPPLVGRARQDAVLLLSLVNW